MVLVCALGLVSVGHAQMGGGIGGGMGGIPGTAFGGANDPSMVPITDGFRVIPSITVAERYDSNVFLSPKSSTLDRSDYVSTVAPQIRGLYSGSAMTVNATVAAVASYYAQHTNLSNVGTNAGLFLDLSPMLGRWWQGATFTVFEQFRYTPEPPSFLAGNHQGDTANLFLTGQQVGRANSRSNTVGAAVSMPVTETLSLTGSYSNGFLKFGSSQTEQAGTLLNSSVQTFTVGMLKQLSLQDSVTLNFIDSETQFEQNRGSFSSRGGIIGWNHAFSPAVTLFSSAGATVVERQSSGLGAQGAQGQSSGPSTGSSTVAPRGNAVLTWRDRTTTLTMAYGLSVVPSNQSSAQPLLSNTVTFAVNQVTTIPELVGVASVNIGRGDQIGSTSVNAVSFSSYAASGGMVYQFTPQTFLNLNYLYSNFDNQFGATTRSFDRHVVSISIAQAFY